MMKSVNRYGNLSVYKKSKEDWQVTTSQCVASMFLLCDNLGSWLDAFTEGTQEVNISLCVPFLTAKLECHLLGLGRKNLKISYFVYPSQ